LEELSGKDYRHTNASFSHEFHSSFPLLLLVSHFFAYSYWWYFRLFKKLLTAWLTQPQKTKSSDYVRPNKGEINDWNLQPFVLETGSGILGVICFWPNQTTYKPTCCMLEFRLILLFVDYVFYTSLYRKHFKRFLNRS